MPQSIDRGDLLGHVLNHARRLEILQPAGPHHQEMVAHKYLEQFSLVGRELQPRRRFRGQLHPPLAVILAREELSRIVDQRGQAQNVKVRTLIQQLGKTL